MSLSLARRSEVAFAGDADRVRDAVLQVAVDRLGTARPLIWMLTAPCPVWSSDPVTHAALITGACRPEPGERVALVITGANSTLPGLQTPAATEQANHSGSVTADPSAPRRS